MPARLYHDVVKPLPPSLVIALGLSGCLPDCGTTAHPCLSVVEQPQPEPVTQPQRGRQIEESHSRAARAIEGRQPQKQVAADAPDLSHMPGAITVSGHERKRSGAAARR